MLNIIQFHEKVLKTSENGSLIPVVHLVGLEPHITCD